MRVGVEGVGTMKCKKYGQNEVLAELNFILVTPRASNIMLCTRVYALTLCVCVGGFDFKCVVVIYIQNMASAPENAKQN